MAADLRYEQTSILRSSLNTVVLPIRWLVAVPGAFSGWTSRTFASRDGLLSSNRELETQVLVLERQVQQLAHLEAENQQLRMLLDARERIEEPSQTAELLSIDADPFTHQIIINKGTNDGAFVKQAVLDSKGLYGQIIEANQLTSRVLLIADGNHFVPVEVVRNGLRSYARGTGSLDRLELLYVASTADIKVGDLLSTSGLGERFPQGYPVATVSEIILDPNAQFATVYATPTAQLGASRQLLIVGKKED